MNAAHNHTVFPINPRRLLGFSDVSPHHRQAILDIPAALSGVKALSSGALAGTYLTHWSNYWRVEMIDIHTLPVHHAADIYPMIDTEEMQQLADDIEKNGQNHPIVVAEIDGEMMLIDGRNRLAACSVAGIEPRWTEADISTDNQARAYILSENDSRRHMNSGQRAMARAMITKPEKGGRGNKLSHNCDGLDSTTKNNVSRARKIIAFSGALAHEVLNGTRQLIPTYEEVKAELKKNGAEVNQKALDALPKELRDKVIDGELTLPGAIAENNEKTRLDRVRRVAQAKNLGWVSGISGAFCSKENRTYIRELFTDYQDIARDERIDQEEFVADLHRLRDDIDKYLKGE